MPHGREGLTVPEFKNLSVRCEFSLVHIVEALVDLRKSQRPFERYSLGDAMRELMARGIETLPELKSPDPLP